MIDIEVVVCEILKEPMSPKVTIIYPKKLKNEKILKESLDCLPSFSDLYIKEKQIINDNKEILKRLIFEADKNKIVDFINIHEKSLQEILDKMNKGIEPYFWKVYTDVKTYFNFTYINSDYVFCLECE